MPLFKNTGPLVRLWAALNGTMYVIVVGVMYFVSSGLDLDERVVEYVTMALFAFLGIALLWRAAIGYKGLEVSPAHRHHRRRRLIEPVSPFKWHD